MHTIHDTRREVSFTLRLLFPWYSLNRRLYLTDVLNDKKYRDRYSLSGNQTTVVQFVASHFLGQVNDRNRNSRQGRYSAHCPIAFFNILNISLAFTLIYSTYKYILLSHCTHKNYYSFYFDK